MSRLRWPMSCHGWPARLRAFWWWNVRRYPYEICLHCGRPVGRWTGTWWRAPDDLWSRVNGGPNGVMCPRCFTAACEERGVYVHFLATVDSP